MSVINKGKTFANGEQLTAAKLNQMLDAATFSSAAVDNNKTTLSGGAITIAPNGVTNTELADSNSKTNGVTFPKIQHISSDNLVGRTSSSDGDVEEVPFVIGGSGDSGLLFDNDDMLDNSDTSGGSATRGATQQSIKAYVDAEIDTTIGHNQTWQNVASSRSNNTVFQNTTGRPIQVCVSWGSDGSTTLSVEVSADNSTYVSLALIGHDPSESGTTFTVPNNHYYKSVGSLSIRRWAELR